VRITRRPKGIQRQTPWQHGAALAPPPLHRFDQSSRHAQLQLGLYPPEIQLSSPQPDATLGADPRCRSAYLEGTLACRLFIHRNRQVFVVKLPSRLRPAYVSIPVLRCGVGMRQAIESVLRLHVLGIFH